MIGVYVMVGGNLLLTLWLVSVVRRELANRRREAEERQTRTAEQISTDSALLDRVEKENLSGPANPAVTAMVANGRRTLERGEALPGAERTFVTAAASQLGGINDFISEMRLKADLAKKGRRS